MEYSEDVGIWNTTVTRLETIRFLVKKMPSLFIKINYPRKRLNDNYQADDREALNMAILATEEIKKLSPKYMRTKLMSSIIITNPTIVAHIVILSDLLDVDYCYLNKSDIISKDTVFRISYRETRLFQDKYSNGYLAPSACFFINDTSFNDKKIVDELHHSLLKKFMRSGCDILHIDVPDRVMDNVMKLLVNAFYCKSQFYKFGETLREPID